MKISMFTTSLIALAVSIFSISAQAEETKRPNLSITSISGAQLNLMKSQGVSRGSSLSTTVTIGGREVRSDSNTTYLNANSQVRQKWLTKKAKVLIRDAVAYYEVQKGDSLSKIAQRYDTTIERMMRINKLKSTKILVGQMLKL
jgi:LysM repeat protein